MRKTDRMILKNGIIITPFEELKDRILFLENKKITKIVRKEEIANYSKDYLNKYKEIDVKGNFISPGFIDIHTHGGNGVDVIEDDIGPLSKLNAMHGTTGYLPTIWTSSFSEMINSCRRISTFMEGKSQGSKVLGINLEGPYLNPDLGGQRKEFVRIPKYEDYSKLVEACNGNLKIMTLAPELDGSTELIRYLRQNDITVSIGHSNLKIEKLNDILDQGITLVTHILNAMGDSICKEPGIKALGIQEELLIRENLMSEVICDKNGIHVKPTWLKILVKCKGTEHLVLITDSMKVTGLPPGRYKLQDGRYAIIEKGDDILKLEEGAIFGTALTLNNAVKNFVKHTGLLLKDSIRLATYNPAKVLGITNKKGEIKKEMDADIAVFDKDINIKLTIIDGDIVYDSL